MFACLCEAVSHLIDFFERGFAAGLTLLLKYVKDVKEISQHNYTACMWPNNDETRRLLDDAKTGEASAVDRLLGEFREPLRQVIDLRLDPVLARRVDASDIVQDVLIEANQRLTEYLKNPAMPFHLWLRHLAQDRIIDTHRRHRQAQRRSIDREQAIQRPGVVRPVVASSSSPSWWTRNRRRPRPRSIRNCNAG